MSKTKREQLFEQKRKEVEEELSKWVDAHGLLGRGERIAFEMRVEEVPLVIGQALDRTPRPPLPEDEPKREGEPRGSYYLTVEDWETIRALRWTDSQAKVITWLHENNNGPVDAAELEVISGRKWDKGITHRVGEVLKQASTYAIRQDGWYFRFGKIGVNSKHYAIYKYGYF